MYSAQPATLQAMLKEMRGYAEAASFNAAGRHAARSALSNFLKTAQMLNSSASLSQVGLYNNPPIGV